MKKLTLTILFLFIASFVLFAQSSSVQIKFKKGILDSVPQEGRESLKATLSDFIEKLNAKDKNRIYDFLSTTAKNGLDEEEFVKQVKIETDGIIKTLIIEEFEKAEKEQYTDEMKQFNEVNGEVWYLKGCPRYSEKIEDINVKHVTLRYKNSKWLIEGIGNLNEHCLFWD